MPVGQKRRVGRDEGNSAKIVKASARPAIVAIVAMPLAHASAFYGGLDILSTAGMHFNVATGSVGGDRRVQPIVVGAT